MCMWQFSYGHPDAAEARCPYEDCHMIIYLLEDLSVFTEDIARNYMTCNTRPRCALRGTPMYGQVWQIALHPEITATPIQSAYLLHPGWLALSSSNDMVETTNNIY